MTGSRLLCFHIPPVIEKRLMRIQNETFMFKMISAQYSNNNGKN